MRKTHFLLAFFCLIKIAAAFGSTDEDIRVTSEVDKAFLTIGDPVTFTVTVEHSPDLQILSSIPAPASDVLEIKKIEDLKFKKKNVLIEGRKFTLTAYRLGEFILDPITIQYRKAGQAVKTIQTDKLFLTVKSIAEGEPKEDIRDVKTVVPFQLRLKKFFLSLGILTAFLLGLWLFRLLKAKRILLQPEKPPLSAEEEALMRLHELFESDLLKKGLVKLFYLRLSEILRIYLERRYQILAVESTTVEILRSLRPLRLDTALYQKIQYVLEAADLAKFAKWIPAATEILQINKKAEEIVKESTPVTKLPSEETSHGV